MASSQPGARGQPGPTALSRVVSSPCLGSWVKTCHNYMLAINYCVRWECVSCVSITLIHISAAAPGLCTGGSLGTIWGGFLGQIPQERGKAASRVELFFWLWPWIRPALQGRGHGQGSLEQAALLKLRASLCGSSTIFFSKQALPQLGKHLKGVSGGVSLSRGCSVAPARLGLASAAAAFPRKS